MPAAKPAFTDALNSWDVRMVSTLGDVLPFFVGIAMGTPLVARELEQGTAPLSWPLPGTLEVAGGKDPCGFAADRAALC